MAKEFTHGQYCLIYLYQGYRKDAAEFLLKYRSRKLEFYVQLAEKSKAKADGIFLAMNMLDHSFTLKDAKFIDPRPHTGLE